MSTLPAASSTSRFLPYLLVLVAGLIAHGLSLRSQFYMDDFMHLVGNARVVDGENLFAWRRLLPYLAYFALHKVAGLSPIAFHALNLTIHLGMSAFVLWATRDFVRFLGSHEGKSQTLMPLLVALVFACHPLASEPVNYARCTPILLVGFFSFVSAWATLRWFFVPERRVLSSAIVVLSVAGATFSKEPGLVHALGSVAVVAWFCRGGSPATERSSPKRRMLLAAAGVGAAVLLTVPAASLTRIGVSAVAKPDFVDHALTQCRVFWMYVQRMLLPVNLSVDHYILWTRSWMDLPALLGLAGIVVVCGASLYFGKRHRLVALAVMLGAFHLLMRMGYVIGHEMMVDYRTYPSLPWISLLIGSFFVWIPSKLKPRLAGICTVAFIVFLCLLSVARSTLWWKPEALARDALRQYPHNNRARAALLRQFLLKNRHQELALEYQVAMKSVAVMVSHNQSPDAVRRYDHDRLIGDWTFAETSYAPALTATRGPDAALAHLDRTIEILSGESKEIGADEPLQDLIAFRERLLEFKKSGGEEK